MPTIEDYTTEMKTLEDQIAALDKQRQVLLVEKGEAVMQDVFRILFKKHPELASFSWKEYTPYFNDGSPCNFRAHTDAEELAIAFSDDLDTKSLGNDYDEEGETWWLNAYRDKDCTAEQNKVRGHLRTIRKEIENVVNTFSEEDLKHFFGDHAKVTVTATGITVDGYDHD